MTRWSPRSPIRRRRIRGHAWILGAILLGLVPATATATVIRGQDVAEYTYAYDDCGFDVEVEGMFASPRSKARVGTGPDLGAFFGHDVYVRTETHTRVDTGGVLILTTRALLHEVSARQVDGTVFEFTRMDVGALTTVTDADGAVLAKDRGIVRMTYLLDTLGDETPGGTFLGVTSETFHGAFRADLCALFP